MKLFELPPEILHMILSMLDLRCLSKCAYTCMTFNKYVHGAYVRRVILRDQLPFSVEGIKYQAGNEEATIRQLFLRRSQLLRTKPTFIHRLPGATHYSYSNGVLCYPCAGGICVLDIHHGWSTTVSFPGAVIPLQFADGVLSCLSSRVLQVRSVSRDSTADGTPETRSISITDPTRIFVRNNADYLVVGTYSSRNQDGHRQWHIRCFDLRQGRELKAFPLPNIIGREINIHVDFKIYDEYFYAASNEPGTEDGEMQLQVYYCRYRLGEDDLESGSHRRPPDIERSVGHIAITRKEDGRICIIESAALISRSRKSYQWYFSFPGGQEPKSVDFGFDLEGRRHIRCYNHCQSLIDLVQSIATETLQLRTSWAGSGPAYWDLPKVKPGWHYTWDVDGRCAVLGIKGWEEGNVFQLVIIGIDPSIFLDKHFGKDQFQNQAIAS